MAQQGVSDMAKYDEMSFGKAFAAARKELGKGKTFTWKGKSYTTNLKEEAAPKKKSESVPVPPPRPAAKGAPVAEMKPSSASTQRSMAMRGRSITTSTLSEDKKSSGRGAGDTESITRRMQAAIDRAKNKGITYDDWKGMSRRERQEAGLPVSPLGGLMRAWGSAGGFGRMSGETKMAYGGMTTKKK